MPINYKQINGRPVFTLDQLSDSAKEVARQEMITVDVYCNATMIRDFMSLPMHTRINNRSAFRNAVRKSAHINKLKQDQKYLDSYILSNVMNFLTDGTYISYSPNFAQTT